MILFIYFLLLYYEKKFDCRPDGNRIKEVGPDRACAEWLLRCGAFVRWKDSEKFHKDYNTLPNVNLDKFKIEEVNADEAAVMDIGFPHFGKCLYLSIPQVIIQKMYYRRQYHYQWYVRNY